MYERSLCVTRSQYVDLEMKNLIYNKTIIFGGMTAVTATGTATALVKGEGPPFLVTNQSMPFKKGTKRINIHMTPRELKIKWARAVLLALKLATSAARFAVMVVPIFAYIPFLVALI